MGKSSKALETTWGQIQPICGITIFQNYLFWKIVIPQIGWIWPHVVSKAFEDLPKKV